MAKRKVDSHRERRIITAMITSKEFLSQADPVIDTGLLSDPYRLVADWCLSYFRDYDEAPGGQIQALFQHWEEEESIDAEHAQAVSDIIYQQNFDTPPDPVNVPFYMKDLERVLRRRKLEKFLKDIEAAVVNGNDADAEDTITAYKRLEVTEGSGFNLLTDENRRRAVYSISYDPVITFDDKLLSAFFSSAFVRSSLVGVQASEKAGKTAMCVELAHRALEQRRRVAFFEVGDLSERDLIQRFDVRWSGRPLFLAEDEEIRRPKKIELAADGDKLYRVIYKTKKGLRALTVDSAIDAVYKIQRRYGLGEDSDYIRAVVKANATINVRGIDAILDKWAMEGFVADVIVIDYADILAPEDPRTKEPRDRSNETWQALRRLSQEWDALVIVPTQANALIYKQRGVQTMANFSNDKRKNAHVTALLGLNQTEEEKKDGVMRLNWIAHRNDYISRQLYVGQCLKLGLTLTCATM